ncbi:hypothetical protein BN1708_017443, partial [Verticillium longisporum]
MDGWNYRMCDITDGETPTELRQIICAGLGLMDAQTTQLYTTELGVFNHDEPLDDQRLLTQKQHKADAVGTLKLFVRPSGYIAQGPIDPNGVPASLAPGTPMDTTASSGTHDRLNGPRTRSSSSPPTSRQNTVSGERPDGKALAQEASEYRAEMERKQREYLAKRRQVAAMKDNPSPDTGTAGGYYGIAGRSVDFDQPRNSPFEEKKPDQLFPARKPPAPPSDPSATLIKANSLSKKTGHQLRTSTGSDAYHHARRPRVVLLVAVAIVFLLYRVFQNSDWDPARAPTSPKTNIPAGHSHPVEHPFEDEHKQNPIPPAAAADQKADSKP